MINFRELFLRVYSTTSLNLLLGLVITASVNVIFIPVSLAQNVTLESRYARALNQIENLRRTTYDKIKVKTRGNVPIIKCDQKYSFDNLPDEERKIAGEYCQKVAEIVQQNQLSFDDFNKITSQIMGKNPKNPELKRKNQTELIKLQK
ncbi:MAG TPA: DUF4168 domain-containing protein [Allocoleopsis sp.]